MSTLLQPLADLPASPQRRVEPGQTVGLLAGAGRFPIVFAQAARRQGYRVHCLGVDGMASDELRHSCDACEFLPLARIGQAIRRFHRAHVRRIVMAGKIEKVVLVRPFLFWRLLPDLRTLHMWFRYATGNKKDDTLLLAVIREFERDGLQFDSALDYCPELLVSHGFLTRRKPTATQWKDICFGWELAKEMGRLDIGQSVMVKETAVLAVEAIEGTDQCIRRAGELCRRGGFTVVKVAKPQQDRRFDVPTIGQQTIQTMRECGAKVLAIEGGQTIVIDQDEVVRQAEEAGITIVAVNPAEMQLRSAA